MRPPHRSPTRAILLAFGAMIASTGAGLAQEETSPDSARTAELEALYEARTEGARIRFTEADVGFMSGMIHHHAQAVVMGRLAPTHGASPSIQTLAARIINAQEDEIATMERWLRDRGQPLPEAHLELPNLTVYIPEHDSKHGAGHSPDTAHEASHVVQQMPGMLTPAQMRELDQARGSEFDRLFLTYMVHDLFGTDGAAQDPATFKLASDIQVDQRTEIDRMERMLSALPGEGGAR